MNHLNTSETIAAIATPLGRGGIGVIRISGPQVPHIAQNILKRLPKPRYATFNHFYNAQGEVIDHGIALYFPAPHSFTGEDILELQGHGGMVIMDLLLKETLNVGARLARPGEFSERAFLNGKLDLTQAEAIADLIDSASAQAARCALRSLQGVFSQYIQNLTNELTTLRVYIEAGIDFVEEEIDLLADNQVFDKIEQLITQIEDVFLQAKQGFLLKEGMQLALIGKPNVGKSSLLNALAGRETAIVTPIPGTTRDIVQEQIEIAGMPVNLIDTAGLRETEDIVEQAGIHRTQQAFMQADLLIILIDDQQMNEEETIYQQWLEETSVERLIVHNKIDLSGHPPGFDNTGHLYLSAKTGEGIALLRDYLKNKMGLSATSEGNFIARHRHLQALQQAKAALQLAITHVQNRQNELLAEELRQAQQALGTITGEVTSEDLLGHIFSSFCIGK